MFRSMSVNVIRAFCLVAASVALAGRVAYADHDHSSGPFQGVKANTGTVMHTHRGNTNILTLSDDFKIPDAPAPHWQIVDSKGNVYLLQRLDIKGGKFNRQITVPSYIKDIAKVQIWCAWAETLLGETSFAETIKLSR